MKIHLIIIKLVFIFLLVPISCKSQKQQEQEDQAQIKETVNKFFEYVKYNNHEKFVDLHFYNEDTTGEFLSLTQLYNKSLVKERKLPKEFKLIYEETKLGGELGLLKQCYIRIPFYIFPEDSNKLSVFSSIDVLIYLEIDIIGNYKKIYNYSLDYKLREDKEKIKIDGGL